jgi:hypothetical protein
MALAHVGNVLLGLAALNLVDIPMFGYPSSPLVARRLLVGAFFSPLLHLEVPLLTCCGANQGFATDKRHFRVGHGVSGFEQDSVASGDRFDASSAARYARFLEAFAITSFHVQCREKKPALP